MLRRVDASVGHCHGGAASRSGWGGGSSLPGLSPPRRTSFGGSSDTSLVDVSVSSVGADGSVMVSEALLILDQVVSNDAPSGSVGRPAVSHVIANCVPSVRAKHDGIGGVTCRDNYMDAIGLVMSGALGAPGGACCSHGGPLTCASVAQDRSVKVSACSQPVSPVNAPVSVDGGGDGSGAEVYSCGSDGHRYGVRRASCGSRCSSEGTVGSGCCGAISAPSGCNGQCVQDGVGRVARACTCVGGR